ncbi:MAG: sugar ABC transporter permease [Spirochaetaceae bacterium]|jgi:raffinose/stachyose/melibiose transport system permease protein|nr:sugar ABC transporter permease [Spirochaetaceae bacterium]
MSIYKRWFWVFAAPALALFLLVIVLPFGMGVFNSFVAWRGTYYFDPVTGSRASGVFDSFVGLANYKAALADERFARALWYTVRYTALAVISINIGALCMALLVNRITRGAGLFRTTFFLPNMLGGLALGFIWQFVFQIIFTDLLFGPGGVVHAEFLRYMTQDPVKALFALMLLNTWQTAGYMMIIYIAGLNNIPKDLYEAANIDGASRWTTFRKITVPMLMPSFTVVFFMTLANSFKLLDQNVALTDGEFNTRMLAMQILRTVKDTTPPDYGKAQAQAVLFFIMIAVITLTQVGITKKRELEL